MFFYLIKLLFSGFQPFKGNFVCGQNSSKYCDWAPLTCDAIGVDRGQALLFEPRYRHVVSLPRARTVIVLFWLVIRMDLLGANLPWWGPLTCQMPVKCPGKDDHTWYWQSHYGSVMLSISHWILFRCNQRYEQTSKDCCDRFFIWIN